jgi:hypothetical protein
MHTFTKTLIALALPVFAIAQNGPIDFETGGFGATWNWTVFENATNPALEIVANPDPSGINTSATVAKFTALQAGNPWAGCETEHGAGTGPFVMDASNSLIRIMVWKSKISDIGIKLVTATGWSKGELKVANTKINEWEQITIDFSNMNHEGNTYDQVVVFPDFDPRTQDEIIYFDNVFGAPAGSVGLNEAQLSSTKIYPNPGNVNFQVESQNVIQELKVFNLTGQLIMSQTVKGLNAEVNAADLPNGVYFVQLEMDNDVEVLRWVKQG